MRAGIITGKHQLELLDLPDPAPERDEVVVAIRRCGICGSDVHAYAEGWPIAPALCGHEWVGEVVAVGTGVDSLGEGDRVTAGQAPGCGRCRECRADLGQYCGRARSEYSGRRSGQNGGFAPYMAVAAGRCVPLADGLDDDRAALVEPASVALHAVRKSRMRMGDVVCVVGCGPIGLFAVQWARLGGAGRVIAVEPDERRRALAVDLGAHEAVAPGAELREAVDAASGGLRADLAIDCAGIPQTLQQSVDMVRSGGSVCMVGVSGERAEIVPMRWMMKEVSVDTSILFTTDEMAEAGRFIADGRVRVTELIDDTIGLDGLPATVDALAARRSTATKVLVDPTAG